LSAESSYRGHPFQVWRAFSVKPSTASSGDLPERSKKRSPAFEKIESKIWIKREFLRDGRCRVYRFAMYLLPAAVQNQRQEIPVFAVRLRGLKSVSSVGNDE
jgi:hypothetical protein